MKKIILDLLTITSISAYSANDNCKSTALKVAAAVDKVYSPKLAKGTKITASNVSSIRERVIWSVLYQAPNAGGQTAYEIELGSDGCNLIKLESFAE